jgi:hypothetical protein
LAWRIDPCQVAMQPCIPSTHQQLQRVAIHRSWWAQLAGQVLRRVLAMQQPVGVSVAKQVQVTSNDEEFKCW